MRDLAAATGTSAARISDYENARVAPTTDVLARIEDVLERRATNSDPQSSGRGGMVDRRPRRAPP